MKRIAIALLFVLVAVSAQAATIFDIQTGMYAEGDLVDLTGVTVTAVRDGYGVWVSEAPFGANNGIYVYGPTEAVAGDIIDIVGGEYIEYYDLSEVKIFDATVTIVSSGAVPAPIMLNAADLFEATPVLVDADLYESCLVTIVDGMTVSEIQSYGQWTATAEDGTVVLFDDYLFDASTVEVGQCYNNATGILDYSYSAYKLQALVDGVVPTDCTVATDKVSFEAVKSLYR